MKLEDGKTYETRRGEKVTVKFQPSPTLFDYAGWIYGDLEYWREDGSWSMFSNKETEFDLIKEVEP